MLARSFTASILIQFCGFVTPFYFWATGCSAPWTGILSRILHPCLTVSGWLFCATWVVSRSWIWFLALSTSIYIEICLHQTQHHQAWIWALTLFKVVWVKSHQWGLVVVPPIPQIANRSRQKTIQGGRSGRRPVTSIVKSLPKASHSRGPSPSHRGQGSVDVPLQVHHHQELHVHDDATQTVAMGVDPVGYGRMAGEAQRPLDESKSQPDHFEGLSKEIYSQACQQVQQLMTIAQQLHQSYIEKDESLQKKLSFEVQMVEAQLQEQISNNQEVLTQFESAKVPNPETFRPQRFTAVTGSFDTACAIARIWSHWSCWRRSRTTRPWGPWLGGWWRCWWGWRGGGCWFKLPSWSVTWWIVVGSNMLS